MTGTAAATEDRPVYPRVLLKLSGESLCSAEGSGVEPTVMAGTVEEIVPERRTQGQEFLAQLESPEPMATALETWALWTAAHHALPVIFVILSNREYRVLKHNLDIYF